MTSVKLAARATALCNIQTFANAHERIVPSALTRHPIAVILSESDRLPRLPFPRSVRTQLTGRPRLIGRLQRWRICACTVGVKGALRRIRLWSI